MTAPGQEVLSEDQQPIGMQVRQGLAWSTINSLSIRVGNVLLGVLLARLLAPEQFGVFAVGLTCQMVLSAFADLGLSADLVRRGDILRRAPTVAALALGFSGLLTVLMAVFAGPIASSLGSADAEPVVRVLALTLLLSGASVVPYALLQRHFMQARTFQADGAALVVSSVVVVALIMVGLGPMALAWSRVAGQVTAVGLMFRFARLVPSLGWDRTIAWDSVRASSPLAVANLLSWALLSVDYVVIGRTLDTTLLGLYVLAFNISAWPIQAIGQAIRNVALPGFARQDQDRPTMTASLERAVALTWTGGAFMGAMLTVLAGPLIVSVYGARWGPAAVALAGLGMFGAIRLVLDLFAAYLVSQGANRSVGLVQAVWLAALVPALVLATGWAGIQGTALAHLAVAVLVTLPAYLVCIRLTGLRIAGLFRVALFPAFAAVLAGAAAAGTAYLVEGSWWQLLLGGSAGTCVYVALSYRRVRRLVQDSRPVTAPSLDHATPNPANNGSERT